MFAEVAAIDPDATTSDDNAIRTLGLREEHATILKA
jgi:hypothetical protein